MPQAIDRRLHAARIARNGDKVTVRARPADLPDGTFNAGDAAPILRWNGALLRWSFSGYHEADASRPEAVNVLTPKPLVGLYAAGWTPNVQM